MDTEAARAQSILDNDGVPVRPAKNEESPLGQIEKATVDFVDSVVKSEKARGELAREEESGEELQGRAKPSDERSDEYVSLSLLAIVNALY